jgi:hypothetical protein
MYYFSFTIRLYRQPPPQGEIVAGEIFVISPGLLSLSSPKCNSMLDLATSGSISIERLKFLIALFELTKGLTA